VQFVDVGSWFLLNNLLEDTVVEMFVEILGIGKMEATGGALSNSRRVFGLGGQIDWEALLASVWWVLLDLVDGSEMTLEDVGTVEGFFGGGAGARTETTDHSPLVMCEGMALTIVLAGESLSVILAADDGALLWSLVLMGEHMSLEVAEFLSAGNTESFLGVASLFY